MSKEEIGRVLSEFRVVLKGGRVQKIYQPSEREVILVIRSIETHMLYFSLDPEFFRVHLIREKPRNPVAPLAFCQFLRKYIMGMRVGSVFHLSSDRVVSITFTGREGEFQLWAELFGRNCNLFITDGKQRVLKRLIERGKDNRVTLEHSLTDIEGREKGAPPESNLILNREAEELYSAEEERRRHENIKRGLLSGLQRRADKLAVRKKKMMADCASLTKLESYLKYGELIKHNFSRLKRGMEVIDLTDYESGRTISVPLDPSLSPALNMNRYFDRYKKSTRGYEKIGELLKDVELEITAVHDKIVFLKNAPSETLKEEWERQGGVAGSSRGKKREVAEPHSFISFDGLPILVGKNSTQNDEITFKRAKGNDIWFHARNSPGSHVVLQMNKRGPLPQESILDAASLALFYSKLKAELKGEVIYTYKKYLRKPKGAKPGQVIYTGDRSIFVHLDSSRVERLMESRRV